MIENAKDSIFHFIKIQMPSFAEGQYQQHTHPPVWAPCTEGSRAALQHISRTGRIMSSLLGLLMELC